MQLLRASGARGLDGHEPEPAMQAGPMDIVGQYAQLIAGAHTAAEVSKQLGAVASRVRQRVSERSLFTVEGPDGTARQAMLVRWQVREVVSV